MGKISKYRKKLIKDGVVKLRKRGLSYREIAKIAGISKGWAWKVINKW